MDLSMQMKALRSENFAKLSSSSSTRDEYWVTSISAGTPAGYCLSQMRSMLFPLLVRFPWARPLIGAGPIIWSSIEHSDGRWQAALRFTRIGHGKVPARPAKALSARRSSGFIRWFGLGTLGFGRMLCRSLRLCRLHVGGLRGSIRLGICMPDVGGFGRARFVVLTGIFGLGLCVILLSRDIFRRDPRLFSAMPRRLLVGVGCDCGNQGGAGPGRTGIDGNGL